MQRGKKRSDPYFLFKTGKNDFVPSQVKEKEDDNHEKDHWYP